MSQLTDDRLNSLGLISRGGGGSRGQEGRTSIMMGSDKVRCIQKWPTVLYINTLPSSRCLAGNALVHLSFVQRA